MSCKLTRSWILGKANGKREVMGISMIILLGDYFVILGFILSEQELRRLGGC